MKPLLCLFTTTAMFLFFSCKKDSSGGGGTGGGSNKVSVAAISPANAYCDDTVTITGTGFDPDKAKDKVSFGILSSSGAAYRTYLSYGKRH